MKQSKPLGAVLDQLLKNLGIADRVDEQKVLIEFETILGESFCRRARAVRIEKGVLVIEVVSSAWRQELFYQKKLIQQRINSYFGENVVKEIIFR
jgi:predicted nucleic acid-binding Zn ribbon protein